MRITHVKDRNYGVKAIWYFEEAIKIDEHVQIPWTDQEYIWKLLCKPIISLPTVFNEDFRGRRKLSMKIPGFSSARIKQSFINLKASDSKAYLECILQEFADYLNVKFDYMGKIKQVNHFLREILPSEGTEEETPVSVTEQDAGMGKEIELPETETPEEKEDTHLRMQYLLVQIGVMEGHDIWVARNDRNKEYNGEKFADICLDELPHFAPQNVLRIAESIDVIWFRKNTAQPACFFEIEHTTSIYSGLLRLNDVKIDYPAREAFIVADKSRQSLFENQTSRRTFSHSELDDICHFRDYQEIEKWYESLRVIQEIKSRR